MQVARSHRHRLAAALVALLAALLLAGCGDDRDANDYRAEIRDVQQRYFADLERHAADATDHIGVDDAAAARSLQQYAATATRLADGIRALEAPEGARDAGSRLVAAYRALATSADTLRRALESDDLEQVDEAVQGFNRAQQDLADAVADLNAASG